MKTQRASQALPVVALTSGEQHSLIEEAAGVLAETLRVEREFREGHAAFGSKQWKEVYSRDAFHVFKERRPKDNVSGGFIAGGHREKQSGIVAAMKDPRVPMIVGAGHVEGQLEDVCFGSLASDDVSWRLRSTYMKDKFAEARIVATVHGPTPEEPYRFLGVKWFMREQPALIGMFVQFRDYLVTEAIGHAVDEQGVPYGYYMIHDFKHPRLPELTELGIIRSQISLCYICRQISPDKVHIFARGFVDLKGDISTNLTATLSAEAMSSTVNSVETSYAKKLSWLMVQSQRQRQQQRSGMGNQSKFCESCGKMGGKLMSGSLSCCQVCNCMYCGKCSVQRKLVVDVSGGGVVDHAFSFCFSCVLKAKQISPRDVAIDTVVRNANRMAVPMLNKDSPSIASLATPTRS
ncbi:hypothetical protein Poli38472_012584 [Pythium oligandrum]|uniref:START-like domain n=1 Tax=Pythium oligandrum TaxID=41045 RepID=A0A8K1FK52_PYTOL|nr:hypothetical protein Poli38472_012584 [Pythium oligandrum]|eukprot:TMW61393.1 hypothetical protein Poli38472_012584 [Pythium oligandrum]